MPSKFENKQLFLTQTSTPCTIATIHCNNSLGAIGQMDHLRDMKGGSSKGTAEVINDVSATATGCMPIYTGSSDGDDRDETNDD